MRRDRYPNQLSLGMLCYDVALEHDLERRHIVAVGTLIVQVVLGPPNVSLFKVSHQLGSLLACIVAHMTPHAIEG